MHPLILQDLAAIHMTELTAEAAQARLRPRPRRGWFGRSSARRAQATKESGRLHVMPRTAEPARVRDAA